MTQLAFERSDGKALHFCDVAGSEQEVACDAIGFGNHLCAKPSWLT
ncbi:hypothetical protein [Pelagibius marinus]|nr:hypothetical protein [Pelagibius marinus]